MSFSQMDISLVAVLTDSTRNGERLVGLGFHSNGRYSQSSIIERRLAPRLLSAGADQLGNPEAGLRLDPVRAWSVMMTNEKQGGHGDRAVAVSALDMALFDLAAKDEGMPLWRWLDAHYGTGNAHERVPVYATGGYYSDGKGLGQLRDEVASLLELGYEKVKIKIGGLPIADDIARVEAALEVLARDGARLAVDANASLDPHRALSYASALANYDLLWFEEPCDPLDFETYARIAEQYPAPIATGENIMSLSDAKNLLRYAGLRRDRDVLQVDPNLCYGFVEYMRILDFLREVDWPLERCIPHGGHLGSLHAAAAFGLAGTEVMPGHFEPVGGLLDETVVTNGTVASPRLPGVGIEGKKELLAQYDDMLD